MTTVGISGHIDLSPTTRILVAGRIAFELASLEGPPVGLTSLAGGADQIFADEVLAAGGSITFVQPCDHIEESFSKSDLEGYWGLRALATEVVAMPYVEPTEEAYEAAGLYIVEHCDLFLAVWDGKPAGGRGGTADIVAHRQASGRPMTVIWPAGSARG